MAGLTRFGISIDARLAEKFDRLIEAKGYLNRSEAVRDLVRKALVEMRWENSNEDAVGTVTIVYDHDKRELSEKLTGMQHRYYHSIISSMHIHLDHHNCLEVLVIKGKSREIQKIADSIIGTKGVKHGNLVVSTTGREL